MLRRASQSLIRSGAGAWCIAHLENQVSRSLSQLTDANQANALRSGIISALRQGKRDFATDKGKPAPPPATPRVNVPKYVPGALGRYASALYITCSLGNALDQVESEIRELAEAASQAPEFKNFAANIFVEKKKRKQIIRDLLAPSNLHEFTKNFMEILAEDGRLKDFEKIAKFYSEIMLAHRGCVRAVVTTVDELSASELENVKSNYISKMLEPGQSVIIEQKINEEILGGIVIQAGDKLMDMSYAKRIQKIEQILLGAAQAS